MTHIGVLMIHGTRGSSREFDHLESVLKSAGYLTKTVDLPAHGDSPSKTLDQISTQEIISHCLDEYAAFSQECDAVVVLGHSLGGICALITGAFQKDKLAGIIALSTPYEYAYYVNYLHGLLAIPIPRLFKATRFLPEGITGHKAPHFRPWWFPRLCQETQLILGQLQETLPNIQVPVCLAHSSHDLIIPYAEMQKIANRINKPHLVQTVTLEACGHQIFPKSRERERVSTMILAFLETVRYPDPENRFQPLANSVTS